MERESTPPAGLFVDLPRPEQRGELLDDWAWLLGPAPRPLLFTACGDVFLRDAHEGAVYFLDVSFGRLGRVADTMDSFAEKLADPAFAGDYLGPGLVADLQAHGKVLAPQQVYSFRVPIALGGEVTLENVEVTDLAVHLSLAGQIARQLKDVPDGAPIGKLDIRMPPRKPWWKFW